MAQEGVPNVENLEKNIQEDLAFLSKFKDTDTIPVLVTYMGGKIYGGSGHEMEPEVSATYEDDRDEWDSRSVKELKELVVQCQKESKIGPEIDYPLAFKDPSTEEKHKSAFGKMKQ